MRSRNATDAGVNELHLLEYESGCGIHAGLAGARARGAESMRMVLRCAVEGCAPGKLLAFADWQQVLFRSSYVEL